MSFAMEAATQSVDIPMPPLSESLLHGRGGVAHYEHSPLLLCRRPILVLLGNPV